MTTDAEAVHAHYGPPKTPSTIEWPAVGCGAAGCTADVWFRSRHPDSSVLPPLTVDCPVHGQIGVHTEPPPSAPRYVHELRAIAERTV